MSVNSDKTFASAPRLHSASAPTLRTGQRAAPWMDLPQLLPGWENSLDKVVGSPRFESSRERLGLQLEQLSPVRRQARQDLLKDVDAEIAQRQERRRLLNLRKVLCARERMASVVVGGDAESSSGETTVSSFAELLEARKRENAERAALLMERAAEARTHDLNKTCRAPQHTDHMNHKTPTMHDELAPFRGPQHLLTTYN